MYFSEIVNNRSLICVDVKDQAFYDVAKTCDHSEYRNFICHASIHVIN